MRKIALLSVAILSCGVSLAASAAPKTLSPSEFRSELEIMEARAAHLEKFTEDGVFKLSIQASELIYSAGHMLPAPNDENAEMWCTMAAQSLRNFIDDMRKGVAGLRFTKVDMADYNDQKRKCLRALKRG